MENKSFAKDKTRNASFVISIISQQSATWHGTVTWLDEQKTVPFRSEMELLNLMNNARRRISFPTPPR